MPNALPYIQFYAGDWLRDPAVRACSLAARGLWFDMLCIAHQCTERGVLTLPNGKPITIKHLARMVGELELAIEPLLNELEAAGVYSVRPEDGAVFSRRMVADEGQRRLRSAWGKQGGNPALKASPPQTPPNGGSSLSMSSSESLKVNLKAPLRSPNGEAWRIVQQRNALAEERTELENHRNEDRTWNDPEKRKRFNEVVKLDRELRRKLSTLNA